ncbi:MAG: hypothetical protein JWO86_3854 [Myxococcaceae bacterium]|jgi:hypothetical protein|nr:hypothetical protein [Myxococcaceae bacterium]MEA2753556.1 hypothetical protein [Myxococcales bacterium]
MQRQIFGLALITAIVVTTACGGQTIDESNATIDTTESALTTLSPERAVAAKLGLPARFAIGLGNDAEGNDPATSAAFTLGPKLDIHYAYLVGLPGEGGWTDWNAPEGQYLTMQAEAARRNGVVPMFTLYQAAAWGENNVGAFNDSRFMTKYWRGVRVMFSKLGAFNAPAIAHIEPDLWGYLQQRGDDPAVVPMKVGALVPECTDLPSNAAGFGKCIVRLARRLSPKVAIGLQASLFAAYTAGQPDPARTAAYVNKVGGADADIVVIETLDRDAGCFENGSDPNCKRAGSFYWDETNVRHPSFHDHLAWAKTVRTITGKPLLWWQMPLGVPANSSGGYASHYRDNRVQYLFSHGWEFAAAGGIGAVFGGGAGNQTTVRTDGGQFKTALTKYLSLGGNGLN